MLRKLRRLSKLSAGELLVFFQLVLFALIARIALTIFALPRVTKIIAWGATNRFLRCLPLLLDRYEMMQLTRLADLAARGTRADGPCLIRALLLFWLLKCRREHASLLIGVRKEDGQFSSHAWIEFDGKVLGENEDGPFRFATLLRF